MTSTAVAEGGGAEGRAAANARWPGAMKRKAFCCRTKRRSASSSLLGISQAKRRLPSALAAFVGWAPPGFSGDKGRKLEPWQRSVSRGPVRRGWPCARGTFLGESAENKRIFACSLPNDDRSRYFRPTALKTRKRVSRERGALTFLPTFLVNFPRRERRSQTSFCLDYAERRRKITTEGSNKAKKYGRP